MIALMVTTAANGVDRWVKHAGEGDDVLFISSLAEEGACSIDQVSGLEERDRITTFDNRGVGRSYTPDEPFPIADVAADWPRIRSSLAGSDVRRGG